MCLCIFVLVYFVISIVENKAGWLTDKMHVP